MFPVQPGGTLEVRVTVNVPRDAASGGYWSVLTVDELDAADILNQTRMDEAVAFAEASPLPDPAELTTDVYSSEPADVQTERALSTSRV